MTSPSEYKFPENQRLAETLDRQHDFITLATDLAICVGIYLQEIPKKVWEEDLGALTHLEVAYNRLIQHTRGQLLSIPKEPRPYHPLEPNNWQEEQKADFMDGPHNQVTLPLGEREQRNCPMANYGEPEHD